MNISEKSLEKVSYLVVVKILEARDLKGESTGGVNPYVKIICGNLEAQQTKTIEKTAYPIWNQSFTFPDLKLNEYELETLELNFNVFDQHQWFTNSLVGGYSVGLSTMKRYPNSDIYKKWLRLTKPEQPTRVVGYLQVSCYILGPGQKSPVHDDGAGGDVDDPMQEQMIKDGATQEMILEAQKALQGLTIVEAPKLNWVNYQLLINIYRAQNLTLLEDDDSEPSAFISVRSQGCTIATNVKKLSLNPIWNQKIQIPVYVPTWNEKVKVTLWHQDQSILDGSQVFLANIPELPTAGDVMNIQTLHSKEGTMAPTWFNMYGIRPMDYKNGMSRLHSSSYMGRILMSFHLQPNDRPQLSISSGPTTGQDNSIPYELWIDIYDLVNCDDLYNAHDEPTTFVTVQGFLNAKRTPKKRAFKNTANNSLTFQNPAFLKLPVSLPEERSQIPHLFINVNISGYAILDDKEKKKYGKEDPPSISNLRKGFIRLNAKDIIRATESTKATWHMVQSLENRKKNVGRLLVNARLVRQDLKLHRQEKHRGRDVQYHFFAQIFSGYELAPNIPEGELRTRVEIKIGVQNQKKQHKGGRDKDVDKKIRTRVMKGRFPQWNWSQKQQMVTLNESSEFASDMCVQLFQIEESLYKGKNQKMVGQFQVPVSSLEKVLFKRPQYYNVIDGEGKLQGKILARFYLLQRDQSSGDDSQVKKIYQFMKKMIEHRPNIVDLKVSVLGIRQLARATENAEMEICLTNYENIHGITVQEAYKKVSNKKGKKGEDDEDGGNQDDEEKNALSGDKLIQMDGVTFRPDGTVRIEQRQEGDADDSKPTKNPNFGKVFVFKQILLQEDMLLWPHLIIKLFDDGIGSEEQRKPETSRIVLPIFVFANSFVDQVPMKLTLAMLMDNHCSEIQKQMNPLFIYVKQLQKQLQQVKSEIPMNMQLELYGREEIQDSQLQHVIDEEKVKLVLDMFDEITDDQKVDLTFTVVQNPKNSGKKKTEKADEDGAESNRGGKQKAAEADDDESSGIAEEDFQDLKNIWADFKLKGGIATKAPAGDKKKKGEDGDADGVDLKGMVAGLNISPFEEDPVQLQFKLDEVVCDQTDKDQEVGRKDQRKQTLEKIREKIQKIQDSLTKSTDNDFQQFIRQQMMNCRQKIKELDTQPMDEETFDNLNRADEDEAAIDYGRRKQTKGALESELDQFIPFLSQQMLQQEFSQFFFTTDNFSINNGIFSAGKQNGSFLRFAVSVVENRAGQPIDEHGRARKGWNEGSQNTGVDDDSDKESCEGNFSGEDSDDNLNGRHTVGADNFGKGSEDWFDMPKEEMDKKIKLWEEQDAKLFEIVNQNGIDDFVKMLFDSMKLDIFRPDTLLRIVENKEYTMRVFVRQCQNLSAVDNRVVNIRNQLAGDMALSSADPFLMMYIQCTNQKPQAVFEGRESFQEETLDPQFYQASEISPIYLQEDWKFELQVQDRGTFSDTLVGSTIIDLEQRRWSTKSALIKLTLLQEADIMQEKIDENIKAQKMQRKKSETRDRYGSYLKNRKEKVKRALESLKKKEMPQSNVEFRPLLHPEKQQAQGVVELFVEILDAEESRMTTAQKYKVNTGDEEYEVRLIIWETRDVPPPDGSVLNAQIRASYTPDGLSTSPIEKETDIHRGCKGGKAVFNWRMKFKIGRDAFPRLTLQCFDVGLSGSTSVGQLTLDLRASIKLLKKVGVLEDKKIWAPFLNAQGDEAGYCLIQLQLLFFSEAENDPVGEAQEEPNKNPVLKVVTEGRSLGDKLAGLGLSLPSIELPDMFGLIKKVIAVVLVVMGLFFVMFMILAVK